DAQVLGLGAVPVEDARAPAGGAQAAGGPFPGFRAVLGGQLVLGHRGGASWVARSQTADARRAAGDDREGSSGQAMRSSSGAGPCFSSIRSSTASSMAPWWAGSPSSAPSPSCPRGLALVSPARQRADRAGAVEGGRHHAARLAR